MSAYTPPVSTPNIRPWIRPCIALPSLRGFLASVDPSPARYTCLGQPLAIAADISASPVGLGIQRRGDRRGRRKHRNELAALPLDQMEASTRFADGIPAQVAQQSRP